MVVHDFRNPSSHIKYESNEALREIREATASLVRGR
jgi:hypothetical protein